MLESPALARTDSSVAATLIWALLGSVLLGGPVMGAEIRECNSSPLASLPLKTDTHG